jgi:hypothetical protein
MMEEYIVIKKGQSIQPCINIPKEFKDINLEIKIRSLLPKGNIRSKLESLFNTNKDINPFEMIQDVEKWQQEQRDEWK